MDIATACVFVIAGLGIFLAGLSCGLYIALSAINAGAEAVLAELEKRQST